MSEAIPRTDEQVVREIARGARSLKEDRAFMAAIGLLQRQWQGELLGCPREDMVEVRGKLQALNAIPQILDSLIASANKTAHRYG